MIIFKKRKNEWIPVEYPQKHLKLCINIFIKLLAIYLYITMFRLVLNAIPNINIITSLLKLIFIILYVYLTYRIVKLYKNNRVTLNKNKNIKNNLRYMIHTLKLYDEEEFEDIDNNRNKKLKKQIVRVIQIRYKVEEKFILIRVNRNGDRFTDLAIKLGDNLSSALGLELESTNINVNYCEYKFLRYSDKRINLSTENNNQVNVDTIRISGNISYNLSETPHSLIVGGTGSGKSFFLFGKIVQYLKLTPKADLRIIDPKKADLSLLRFVPKLEDKVATEPHQIAKMLREAVELMEERYSTYFSNRSAFGKTYKDFNLPVVIVIFDEFSAFIHSVDKKLAKEVLDYIFVIIMKGRQAGVQIELLMQRPSADDLPTNIRAQMGFKAGLGNMDNIGYNMIFDTNNVEYKSITVKGGGYIQIDGKHTSPIYFETPMLSKDFDFISEIERLLDNE